MLTPDTGVLVCLLACLFVLNCLNSPRFKSNMLFKIIVVFWILKCAIDCVSALGDGVDSGNLRNNGLMRTMFYSREDLLRFRHNVVLS